MVLYTTEILGHHQRGSRDCTENYSNFNELVTKRQFVICGD